MKDRVNKITCIPAMSPMSARSSNDEKSRLSKSFKPSPTYNRFTINCY